VEGFGGWGIDGGWAAGEWEGVAGGGEGDGGYVKMRWEVRCVRGQGTVSCGLVGW